MAQEDRIYIDSLRLKPGCHSACLIIGPLAVLTQIAIFGTAADGAIAHIMYFREI